MRLVKVLVASTLVITTLSFPAAAGRRTTAPAPTAAQALEQRARLLRGLPVDEALTRVGTGGHAAETFDEAYLVRAGDLDGDKGEDLVDVRYHVVMDEVTGWTETVTLEAHRGRDGKQLWSVTLPPASFVVPIFAKVGTDAKPGVLLFSYNSAGAGAEVAAGGEFDLRVTAYAGATGTPLWATAAPGAGAESVAGAVYAGSTMAVGTFDAVTGAASDVLLVQSTEGGTIGGYAGAAVQAWVLDGATGAYRPMGAPVVYEDWDWYYAVGDDFDGDGLDDALAASHDEKATLSALSSFDGAVIWSTVAVPANGDWWDLNLVGDATGDGVGDVAVGVAGGGLIGVPSPLMSAAAAGGPAVVLVNGATGKTAWNKRGSYVAPLGDADRKKGVELVVGDTLYGSRTGFTAAAYTGSGRRLWSVTRSVAVSGRDFGRASWAAYADYDANGITDIGYAIYVTNSKGKPAATWDGGAVDGRTGKVTRDPLRDMYGTAVAVDGRGSDAYVRTSSGGALSVSVYTGDTGRALWSVTVAGQGLPYRGFGAYTDADRCGELVFALRSGEGTYTDVVLAGKSGKPQWALTRTGTAAGKVTVPVAKRHKQHRKTC